MPPREQSLTNDRNLPPVLLLMRMEAAVVNSTNCEVYGYHVLVIVPPNNPQLGLTTDIFLRSLLPV